MTEADRPAHLAVGIVRRPHGVKGAMTVSVLTDHPAAVFTEGRRLLIGDRHGVLAGGTVTVEHASPHKGGYLIVSREHGAREAVDGLRGAMLLIPAEEAVDPEPDEFFFHQLVGLTARVGEMEVGVVAEVLELPAGPALLLRREKGRDLVIPFVRDIVQGVSLEERVVKLDPPEGLLEL